MQKDKIKKAMKLKAQAFNKVKDKAFFDNVRKRKEKIRKEMDISSQEARKDLE